MRGITLHTHFSVSSYEKAEEMAREICGNFYGGREFIFSLEAQPEWTQDNDGKRTLVTYNFSMRAHEPGVYD